MSLKQVFIVFFLSSAIARQIEAHALTKMVTSSGARLKQFAFNLKPQQLALLARAEIKRPSFWLIVAGSAVLGQIERHRRLEPYWREEAAKYNGPYPFTLAEDHETRKKRNREHEERRIEAKSKVAEIVRARKSLKNTAFGIWFFAGLARYKGY